MNQLNGLLNSYDPHQTIVAPGNYCVKKFDIETLMGDNWLNDQVVCTSYIQAFGGIWY